MTAPFPLLIVERDQSMRVMLKRFFVRQQVDAQTAASVTEARMILAQRLFRVVLTDLFLPHNDGLILLQHLHQVAPLTRVVVMGAFPTPQIQQQVINDGAYAFIEKPFRLERLWTVVCQALHENPQAAICASIPHKA